MSATPLDLFLSKLPSARRNGTGWTACCPAHDDRRPSLSIREGEDGKVLVHCHAGCTIDDICAAIGVRPSELFQPSIPITPAKPSNGHAQAARGSRETFATAREAVAELERRCGPRAGYWV